MKKEKVIEKNPAKLISIEETIIGLRRPLTIVALSGVLGSLVVLGIQILILNYQGETKDLSNFEVCFKGMKSITENLADPSLVKKEVIKDVEKMNFTIDEIHLVKVVDHYTCDVLTRDKKGVRRYQVVLDKSRSFEHLYKISQVSEKKVNSRYQL